MAFLLSWVGCFDLWTHLPTMFFGSAHELKVKLHLRAVGRRRRQDAHGQPRSGRWSGGQIVDRSISRWWLAGQRLHGDVDRKTAAGFLQCAGVGDRPTRLRVAWLGGEQTSPTDDEEDEGGDKQEQHGEARDDDADHRSRRHDAVWRRTRWVWTHRNSHGLKYRRSPVPPFHPCPEYLSRVLSLTNHKRSRILPLVFRRCWSVRREQPPGSCPQPERHWSRFQELARIFLFYYISPTIYNSSQLTSISAAELSSSADRRDWLYHKFVSAIAEPSSCLDHLLISPRSTTVILHLEHVKIPQSLLAY